ncbi:hypothetical protein [Pseudomonas chlororaphis]|uniref:hypothetical protein n=1 Tax=Pseudomonas chlororaphis TaxID=587753 RepID=UPI0007B37091|nr:hypothetical protein [Pseudomonas chlororaphis]AZC64573.1 hypothetical protein C4K33_4089 [Pseudomonas chlororaphis subsp. piscium]KZO47948.1 hypothetical protein PCL1391_3811 [Pseudomonas chlororaphis subsp. piscium]MBP5070295.1 hypothetical protein [Pseudomonas chlororaphis]MBP5077100.1 hypothetical protein [Pseudomonas chlororaphis]QTT88009.1 hypothetical protein HUT28_11670 [Pseudomonas chlororaphis]
MPINKSVPRSPASQAASLVLREAKRLHRTATSGSLASALPILRRLLASNSLPGLSLPELYRQRDKVQRKHLLRTLASEAGFAHWETYRQALDELAPEQLQHFELVYRQAGHLNCWFSSPDEAREYVAHHGGRLLCVGQQAVVLVDLPAA